MGISTQEPGAEVPGIGKHLSTAMGDSSCATACYSRSLKKKTPREGRGLFVFLVPKAGLEPARAFARHPLKMVCLPSSTTSARQYCTNQMRGRQAQRNARLQAFSLAGQRLSLLVPRDAGFHSSQCHGGEILRETECRLPASSAFSGPR
jgi:hypothetical protein